MSLTYAVSMMRNEIDVVEGCIRHMATQVDHIIVADNGSTDGTREILDQLAHELPLTVVHDPDPAYYQARKMTALADKAGLSGADWVIPFDADEIWYSPHGRIADALAVAVGNLAPAELFNHWCTALDGADGNPFQRMVWRAREPGALPKVAFRWVPGCEIHQGNHGVTIPGPVTAIEDVVELRHFPYRSAQQFVAKAIQGAAAYKAAADLPADMGAHWRMYGEIYDRHGQDALEDVFRQHFWHLSPIDSDMVRDPAPYRAAS